MSSYLNLLRVFRESILEEAGLQEDARNDEFAFRNWLMSNKYVSYEDGILDLGPNRSFVLENSNIEYLPKDLKTINANEIIFRNCNLKELKNIIIKSYNFIIENCNNLTNIDVERQLSTGYMTTDGYFQIRIINCKSLKSVSLKPILYYDSQGKAWNPNAVYDLYLYDNPNLTDISNIQCVNMNITHTNITDLSKNIHCQVLAVEDDKQINIPFECERIDMKDENNFASYFVLSRYKKDDLQREKNKVFYNSLKGKSEEEILNAICEKQNVTINGNTMTGDLEIRDNLLKEFPNNITTINGSLTIDNCSWNSLPYTLTAVDILEISNCPNMKQLSNNLTVNRKLHIWQCPNLKQLPNILNCKDIFIQSTSIESLPNNLNCDELYLIETNLTNLPEGLKVKKLLVLNGNNITKLPDSLKDCELIRGFKGNKNLYPDFHFETFKPERELNDGLFLNVKYINASNKNIKELPEGIDCKILILSNNKLLKELPEDLKVETELDLTGTGVVELPQSLKSCKCITGFIGDKTKYPGFHFAEEDNSFDEDDI